MDEIITPKFHIQISNSMVFFGQVIRDMIWRILLCPILEFFSLQIILVSFRFCWNLHIKFSTISFLLNKIKLLLC